MLRIESTARVYSLSLNQVPGSESLPSRSLKKSAPSGARQFLRKSAFFKGYTEMPASPHFFGVALCLNSDAARPFPLHSREGDALTRGSHLFEERKDPE